MSEMFNLLSKQVHEINSKNLVNKVSDITFNNDHFTVWVQTNFGNFHIRENFKHLLNLYEEVNYNRIELIKIIRNIHRVPISHFETAPLSLAISREIVDKFIEITKMMGID